MGESGMLLCPADCKKLAYISLVRSGMKHTDTMRPIYQD